MARVTQSANREHRVCSLAKLKAAIRSERGLPTRFQKREAVDRKFARQPTAVTVSTPAQLLWIPSQRLVGSKTGRRNSDRPTSLETLRIAVPRSSSAVLNLDLGILRDCDWLSRHSMLVASALMKEEAQGPMLASQQPETRSIPGKP